MPGLTVAELVAKLRLDTSEFERGMAAAHKQMQQANTTFQTSGKSMQAAAAGATAVGTSHKQMGTAVGASTSQVKGNTKAMAAQATATAAATQQAGRFTGFLRNNAAFAMSGFVKGIGAMAGAMVLWESVTYAGRVEEMNIALERVGKNVGWTTGEIKEQISAIKEMGITTDVAQYTLSQFARANLDVAKASELARVAQDAAIFAGRDSSETLRWLIYGVQTYQTEIFRTQGLNVNVGKSFETYAKSVNKSAEALTESERQTAVLNEVLKTGATIAGAYEAAMESGSKQMRSMPRYFTEIKEAIGGVLLPAFTSVVFAVKDLISWFRDAVEDGGLLANIFQAVGDIATGVFGAMGAGLKTLTTFLSDNKFAAEALGVVLTVALAGGALKAAMALGTHLVAALTKVAMSMATNLGLTQAATIQMGGWTLVTQGQTLANAGLAASFKVVAASIGSMLLAAAPMIVMTAAIGALAWAWQQSRDREEEATNAAKEWLELRKKIAGVSDDSPIGEQLGFARENITELERQIARVESEMEALVGGGGGFFDGVKDFFLGNAADLIPEAATSQMRRQLEELVAMEEALAATLATTTAFVTEQGAAFADVEVPTFSEAFTDDFGTFIDLIGKGEEGMEQLQAGLASVGTLDISTRKGMLEFSALAEAAGIEVPESLLEAANGMEGFTLAQERMAARLQREYTQQMVDASQATLDAGVEFTRVADILGIDLANATTKQMETMERWTGSADDATGVSVALSEAFVTLDGDASSLSERIGALSQVTEALMTSWYGVENARGAFQDSLAGFVEDYQEAESDLARSTLVQGLIEQFAAVGQALANDGTGAVAGARELSRLQGEILQTAEDAGIVGPELATLSSHLDTIGGVHVGALRIDGLDDVQAVAQTLREDIASLTDDPAALSSVVESLITGIGALNENPVQRRNLIEEWFGPLAQGGTRRLGQGLLFDLLGDDEEAKEQIRGVIEAAGLLTGSVVRGGGGLNQDIRDNMQVIQDELDSFMEQFPRQLTFYAEILPTLDEANEESNAVATREAMLEYYRDHPIHIPVHPRVDPDQLDLNPNDWPGVPVNVPVNPDWTWDPQNPWKLPEDVVVDVPVAPAGALDGLNIQGFTGPLGDVTAAADTTRSAVENFNGMELKLALDREIFQALNQVLDALRKITTTPWLINIKLNPSLFSDINHAANELAELVQKFNGMTITIAAKYSLPQGDPDIAAFAPGGSAAAMAAAAISVFGGHASGYRSPEENAAVGGAANSYHMDASNPAQDLVTPNMPATFSWLRQTYGDGAFRELIFGNQAVFHGSYGGYSKDDHWDHIHLAKRGGIFSTATPAIIGEAGPEIVLPLSRPNDMLKVLKASGAAAMVGRVAMQSDIGFATGGAAGLPPAVRQWLQAMRFGITHPDFGGEGERKKDERQARLHEYQQLLYAIRDLVASGVQGGGMDFKALQRQGMSVQDLISMADEAKQWRKDYVTALQVVTLAVGEANARQAASWGLSLERMSAYADAVRGFSDNMKGIAAQQFDVVGGSISRLSSGRSAADLENWANTIRQLQSMGLDPQLLRQLVEAGPDAARQAQRILASGTSGIANLNSQRRAISDTMTSLTEDIVAASGRPGGRNNVVTAGENWSTNWARGVARGLMNNEAIRESATRWWHRFLAETRRAAGIQSPSKIAAKKIGMPIGEGILEGIASVPTGGTMASLLGGLSGDVEVGATGSSPAGSVNHFHVSGFLDRQTVDDITEAQRWAERMGTL